jgi:hypothetical protein
LVELGKSNKGTLHIVLQDFNFEMQHLLDDFIFHKSSVEDLVDQYREIGTEPGNPLRYSDVLEAARDFSDKKKQRVYLHAGAMPMPFVVEALTKGLDRGLEDAK